MSRIRDPMEQICATTPPRGLFPQKQSFANTSYTTLKPGRDMLGKSISTLETTKEDQSCKRDSLRTFDPRSHDVQASPATTALAEEQSTAPTDNSDSSNMFQVSQIFVSYLAKRNLHCIPSLANPEPHTYRFVYHLVAKYISYVSYY